jgi:hypothetical protein
MLIAGDTPMPHMFRDVIWVATLSRGRSGKGGAGEAHAASASNAATGAAARPAGRRIAFTFSIHLFYFAARLNQHLLFLRPVMDLAEQ